jgi:hypothetical protein
MSYPVPRKGVTTLRKLDAIVYVVVMAFSPRITFTNTATIVVVFPRVPPQDRQELAETRFLDACQRLAYVSERTTLTRDADRAFQISIGHLSKVTAQDIKRELRQAAEEAGLSIDLRITWLTITEDG